MGVYSNTVSISQFRVLGELPQDDCFVWLSSALARRSFKNIEQSAEELSEGWTRADNPDDTAFDAPDSCWRDRYLFFSYRRDQRRIPAALLKSHVGRAVGEYLAKRPELKRPPRQERDELTDRVKLSLLARSLPAPSTVDLVWHVDTGILTLFSSSAKAMERVEELFVKSFEHLRTQLIYPYSRSQALLDQAGKEQLVALNQAGSDAALDEIRSNRWIGEEFLLWLLHGGLEGESFHVCTVGHFNEGSSFSAWIDDRIQLQGGGEAGPQKVSVSGSQDHFLEALSALKTGKTISSAIIHLEKDELEWRFALNAELFTFSSFKCPPVKLERDGGEETSERESVFYERMYLLEAGLQMFDSLLLQFFRQRLGNDWSERMKVINAWLEG
jgi:hypothetical protein